MKINLVATGASIKKQRCLICALWSLMDIRGKGNYIFPPG